MPCNGGTLRRALAFVGFMVGLDASLTPMVLPAIRLDFGQGSGLAAPTIAYVLGAAIAAPLFAQLQERHGRQTMLRVAIGLFVLGAGLSGLSHDVIELFPARLLQGVGGGGLIAVVMANGWRTLGAALGLLLGPWLGVLLLTLPTWRWAFVLELASGIVAVVAAAFARDERQASTASVDTPGAILLASLLSCTVLVATFAGASMNVLMMAGLLAAVSLLVGSLIFVESHVASPLLPPSLLREPRPAACLLLAACLGYVGLAALTFGPVALGGEAMVWKAMGMTAFTGPLVLTAVAANRMRGLGLGRWPAAVGSAIYTIGSAIGFGNASGVALLMQGFGLGLAIAHLSLWPASEALRRGLLLFGLVGGLIGISVSSATPWSAMTILGAVMIGLASTFAISPRGRDQAH
jgi:MFS family permease